MPSSKSIAGSSAIGAVAGAGAAVGTAEVGVCNEVVMIGDAVRSLVMKRHKKGDLPKNPDRKQFRD